MLFFFLKNFFLFSILSRDPNEQLCKVSAFLTKLKFFLTNYKIAFFNSFWGSKKMGPVKIFFLSLSYALEPRWTTVPNLLHLGCFKHTVHPGHWFCPPRPLILPTQATDSPHPGHWFCPPFMSWNMFVQIFFLMWIPPHVFMLLFENHWKYNLDV